MKIKETHPLLVPTAAGSAEQELELLAGAVWFFVGWNAGHTPDRTPDHGSMVVYAALEHALDSGFVDREAVNDISVRYTRHWRWAHLYMQRKRRWRRATDDGVSRR